MKSEDRSTPFAYEPPPPQGITRGAFRVLLFLTGINTVLLGLFVLGPGLQTFVKTQWAAWQAQRAATAKVATMRASQQNIVVVQAQCLAFNFPVGKLIYDDTPAAATRPATSPADAAEWPAAAPQPVCFQSLPNTLPGWGLLVSPQYVPVFMHERKATPNSPAQLVIVWLDSRNMLIPSSSAAYGERRWIALTIDPATKDTPMRSKAYSAYEWIPPLRVSSHRDIGDPPNPRDPVAVKVLAGEIDPADGSAFTIPYELDGVHGKITGRLTPSGLVDLIPSGPYVKGWKRSSSDVAR